MAAKTKAMNISPMPDQPPNREDIVATWVHKSSRPVTQKLTANRWEYVELGINRIMNELDRGLTLSMYMGIYTCVDTRHHTSVC